MAQSMAILLLGKMIFPKIFIIIPLFSLKSESLTSLS